jgi:hypothetical protein
MTDAMVRPSRTHGPWWPVGESETQTGATWHQKRKWNMSILTNTIVVVLGLPTNHSVLPLVLRSTSIVNAMEANKTTFASPNPPLTQVTAAINALTAAETAYKAHLGTRADRDAAYKAVVALMHQVHAYVQALATASPASAETIAQDAAMTLRKTGAHPKSDLAVHQKISGTVTVVAKAGKGSRAHDWQYSTDGGKTWTLAPTTTKASTIITGLTPGVLVTYRHRSITKAGPSDWSQPVSAIAI